MLSMNFLFRAKLSRLNEVRSWRPEQSIWSGGISRRPKLSLNEVRSWRPEQWHLKNNVSDADNGLNEVRSWRPEQSDVKEFLRRVKE